jgi:hypothetical protein
VYKRLFNIKDSNILLKDNNTSTEISFSALFEGDYTNNYYIQYKINPEPLIDKTFTNIEYIADCFKVSDNIDSINTEKITSKPFSTLTVWNEYQQGKANLNKSKYPNAKNKFRIWRDDIPRDSANGRDRIRNPWIYLKLSNDNNLNNKMVFHNLLVKYYK